MPSVSSALQQLGRYAEHTGRYLSELYDNRRLEAQHGLADDHEWLLTTGAKDAYHHYGVLLRAAVDKIRLTVQKDAPKHRIIKRLQRQRDQLRSDLDTEEALPGFFALISQKHADWEALDVMLDIMKGDLYVSNSYRKWNSFRTNRWYHTPYLPDEGALTGAVFWVNPQTRLVLFDDRLQLRWRQGKVLLDIAYAHIDSLQQFSRKRKEHLRFHLRDGSEETIDVSWVQDLNQLMAELETRSVKVSSCLLPTYDSRSAHT